MQQFRGQDDEEVMEAKERLTASEAKQERINQELKHTNKAADEQMSNGKVTDVFTEVSLLKESLLKSDQDLKLKEKTIASLQIELEKTKRLEGQLIQKDAAMEKMRRELSNSKASEALRLSLLSRSEKRIQELEVEVEKWKESQMKMLDSFDEQTNRLEQANVLLEESKLEIESLNEKIRIFEDSSVQLYDEWRSSFKGLKRVKSEPKLALWCIAQAREAEEDKDLFKDMKFLRDELKQAVEAEEKSQKAMDDLALALTEVAAEANQAKGKLSSKEEEIEHLRKEAEELKEKIQIMEEEQKLVLEKMRKEADLYRNTSERLRLEVEDSGFAWNEKEMGFVDCIKRAEDEKATALEENIKLAELLMAAENASKTAKEDAQKVRDILKQALNEANVAKEAAEIARAENSQLKDLIAEKDDALNFITRENENLRINEVAAFENIKELKRIIYEASGKEFKMEEKLKDHKSKQQQTAMEKEPTHGKKLSHAFSFNIKDLIIHNKHKDVNEHHHKLPEKMLDHKDGEEDSENADPLRGSIFDEEDSPVVAAATHPRKKSCSPFAPGDDKEAIYTEDYSHHEGAHIDRKKKALLRRFGDAITRRRSYHRKELSVDLEHQKKDITAATCEDVKSEDHHRKELSVSSGEEQQEAHGIS